MFAVLATPCGDFPAKPHSANNLAAEVVVSRVCLESRHWTYVSGLDEVEFAAAPQQDLENTVAACRRATAAGDAAAAIRCLTLAWAGLRLTGPLRLVDTLARALGELQGGLGGEQRLTVEWLSASACFACGALADAASACERGVAILDSCAIEATAAARMLTLAGEVAAAQGAAEHANRCFDRATALCEGTAMDPASRCHLLNARGLWAVDCGRQDEARALYDRALAVAEAAGDGRWQGGVLGNLGLLTHSQGKLDEAIGFYERALALSTTSGDKRWEGNMRCNLGLAWLATGVSADARKQLLAARDIARALGSPALESVAECNLGVLAMVSGSESDAHGLPHLRQAIKVACAAGDSRTAAQATAYLACALCRSGDRMAAEGELEQLGQRDTEPADALARGVAWCARAELAAARGDPARAAASLREAREVLVREQWSETSELGVWLEMTYARLQLPRLAMVGSYGSQKT